MNFKNKGWILASTVGLILFMVLFYIATILYPGGSYFNYELNSFSWAENYWCDLLDNPTISNRSNPATVVAESAMFIAAVSISLFWISSTHHYNSKQYNHIIQITGGLGGISILLLVIDNLHDIGLITAGLLSLTAISFTLYKLFKEHKKTLFNLGLLSIFISILSYTLYFAGIYREALPIIQKVNFIIIILWIITMNISNYKSLSLKKSNKT